MGEEADRWHVRYEREHDARRQAEEIAERAIADLYQANRDLDRRVTERTVELEVALEGAEAADRAKSTFLHGLAHELSTPLHAIGGLVELIRERSDDTEIIACARHVEMAADRLNQALRTLLEFAAASTGQLDISPIDIRLGELADRVVRRWRRRAAHRGLLLIVDTIPDPSASAVTDPDRLDQILDPLIDNAVRYGAGRIVIQLELTQDGRELRVRVSDEGQGIDEQVKQRVFDAFFRGDGSTGFGVGLTLARATAEMLGGEVGLVPSTAGTTVEASIPLREV